MRTRPIPVPIPTSVMKQPPDTIYTVRVLGNTETRISQLELINLLFAIEDSLHLEQRYLRYQQEKPLQI